MIIRENIIEVPDINPKNVLNYEENNHILDETIFFDLEHYVYKVPICIGVFGCCYYDCKIKALKVTQYMLENRSDSQLIVNMSKKYFVDMYKVGKRNIVTFSGNNDFTVINYLLSKYKIHFNFDNFDKLDIQEVYKQRTGICTGLKTMEKNFNIIRESETISGSNLAKTFGKMMKDEQYVKRMPKEKIEKILLYNEQDVVNLFNIMSSWYMFVKAKESSVQNGSEP